MSDEPRRRLSREEMAKNPCFQRTLSGMYRRIKPDPPVHPTPAERERMDKIKKAQLSVTREDKIRANRLADADFLYAISPGEAEALMKLPLGMAQKLRRMSAYKIRLAELKLKMNQGAEREIARGNDRLKMAMSELVPRALDVLRVNLESEDETVRQNAAKEILDRDGRMPKVSRVQAQVAPPSRIPDVNDETLAELKNVPKTAVQ